MAQAAHVARVRSLYRRALKSSLDWCMTLEVWRPQALKIRDRFEANRNVASMREAERLCEEAERELETMRHPDPYCTPYHPDGSKWERSPFPTYGRPYKPIE